MDTAMAGSQPTESVFTHLGELGDPSGGPARFVFTESRKSFDPKAVYGDVPNPTQL